MVLAILVLIALLTPGVQRGRRLSRRAECMRNLQALGIAAITHAGQQSDSLWWLAPHAPAAVPEVGSVDYAPGKIGIHRHRETTFDDREISTTRNLYSYVWTGSVLPRSFICPDSGDEVVEEDALVVRDFASIRNVSYGHQVPYGQFGKPCLEPQGAMPLAADKGPYGVALESGGQPPDTPAVGTLAGAADWRPWNSPNHGGEGQHVLFSWGNVSWCRVPVAGVGGDNIYTRWSQADGGLGGNTRPRMQGTPPTRNETPWSDTDTLIYP